jgi:microcompartment protein CcmK/EutM
MMTIKALVPFVGEIVMNTGETREVSDEIAKDLIGAGYAEKVGGSAKAEPKTEAKPKAKKGDKS